MTTETETRHIPSKQPKPAENAQPQPDQLPDNPAQAMTAPEPAPASQPAPRKKRKASTLTLEEQEEAARQKVALASKELARIRLEREKQTKHLKLLLAEIVIATVKRHRRPDFLDAIIKSARQASVPITATDDELAGIYRLAAPDTPDVKKAAPEGTA